MHEYRISELRNLLNLAFVLFNAFACIMGITHPCPQIILFLPVIVGITVYYTIFLFTIYSEEFEQINVEPFNKFVILKGKNNNIISIPFKHIKRVSIYKCIESRAIIFHRIGHIKIYTIYNDIYDITIEKIDTFIDNFPPELAVDMDEALFYDINWNKN